MPLKQCTLDNRPGWKWGDEGKCYTYEKGDISSEETAREKANSQGAAIEKYRRIDAIRSYVFRKDMQVLSDDQVSCAITHFKSLTFEDLSRYEVVGRIGDITPYIVNGDIDEKAMISHSQRFLNAGSIDPRPDEESFMDKNSGASLIRYKYEGPQDSKNREFCAYMMGVFSGSYFRKEDINQMSFSSANNEFGTYSIWNYKGSFNCRHAWVAYVFRLKEGQDATDATNIRRSAADSSKKNTPVK